jgi:hypothetical protein
VDLIKSESVVSEFLDVVFYERGGKDIVNVVDEIVPLRMNVDIFVCSLW